MLYIRSGTHGLKGWVGIEGGKVRRNVICVGMSVSVSHVMCYGVFSIIIIRSSIRASFMKKL